MAIPEATLTVKDGALGIVAASANGVDAKIGCCSSGTANTVYAFNDPNTMKDTLGTGPLVEAAAHLLAVAGGPVICVKTPSSTAGAAAAPVATHTGTATLGTPAGGAYDAYSIVVKIVDAGATLVAATATFIYSLDAGRTWSPTIAMPASGVYVMPNTGLTFTWTYSSGAAFVAGDYWTVAVSGPASTLTEIQTAIDALVGDAQEVFNVHVLGIPADVSAGATMYSALETKMQSAATTYFKYAYATMELPSDTDANIKTAFASLSGTRVEVAAGYENITSAISGAAALRPAGWSSTARAAAVRPSEDLGYVERGNLKGVLAISRDEYKTGGLDVARFTTTRTVTGRNGFFLTTGRLLAPVGSDFQLIQNRRVMDIASRVVRQGQLIYLNDSVRVDSATGLILEADARAIETRIENMLRDALTTPGEASAVSAQVDRSVNILSTQTLKMKYRVTPRGYAKTIQGEIGFSNPALVAA